MTQMTGVAADLSRSSASSATYNRLTVALEWPLALLALAVVPALILEDRAASATVRNVAFIVNWVVWLGFKSTMFRPTPPPPLKGMAAVAAEPGGGILTPSSGVIVPMRIGKRGDRVARPFARHNYHLPADGRRRSVGSSLLELRFCHVYVPHRLRDDHAARPSRRA